MMLRIVKMAISLVVCLLDSMGNVPGRLAGSRSPGRGVVLYYHSVADSERRRFAWQMDQVARRSHPVSLDGMRRMGEGRYVLVTFDDGFECVARNALPELERRGIPSMMFLPSGCLGRHPDWLEGTGHVDLRERILGAGAVRELTAKPLVAVGSHCRTHRNLLSLDDGEALREIRDSKAELESLLGSAVGSISFPFGAYENRHVAFAIEAGYEACFSISPEPFRGDGRVVGRVRVDPADWPLEFYLKMTGAYRWMAPVSAMKRRLRQSIVGFLHPVSSAVSRDRGVR
jgi:peptidoglycan/xylan/chitin deacetylase (PgdA/CDA1 family)